MADVAMTLKAMRTVTAKFDPKKQEEEQKRKSEVAAEKARRLQEFEENLRQKQTARAKEDQEREKDQEAAKAQPNGYSSPSSPSSPIGGVVRHVSPTLGLSPKRDSPSSKTPPLFSAAPSRFTAATAATVAAPPSIATTASVSAKSEQDPRSAPPTSLAIKKRSRQPSVDDMRRKMVADYVVNQIYLLGSMCLDRNYVSMRLIEQAYPYEYLIAIIVGDNPPEVLRAYIRRRTTTL